MVEPLQRRYRPGDEPVAGYQLQAFLGRGGFGEVWKASGPGGIPSAVKIIHDLDRRRGGKELRALRLLRDIRHPNLVPLLAYWLKSPDGALIPTDRDEEATAAKGPKDTEVLWPSPSTASPRGTLLATPASIDAPAPAPAELVIAMGLAEKSLYDRLIECRDAGLAGVPTDELLTYLEDAARAIDLLNTRHDIQHCDIKPQNILLLSGAAQVCDFGLAKMIGEVRETSMGAGTIAYGAPEVLLGKGPTATTDQYSLAISYFELRTGELPFGSEWLNDVLQAKQSGAMQLGRLPPAERDVLTRAAAVDPARRFSSCQEMVRALKNALGHPVASTWTEIPSLVDTQSEVRFPTGPAPARNRRMTWPWTALGSLGVAAGIAAWWVAHPTEPAGRATVHRPIPASVPLPDNAAPSGVSARSTSEGMDATPPRSPEVERELRKADQVLAEADATLAAAKAALAASQVLSAHPSNLIPSASTAWAATAPDIAAAAATADRQRIAAATEQTASSTRQIAESTREIALSLDSLRAELSQATQRGGLVENPQTPSDFYHNARISEQRGDLWNARQAYLRLLAFRLPVVDPYARFVGLLRLQEGRAGARETFAELLRDGDNPALRYAVILMEPDESRAEQWRDFVARNADFAPAVYEWSREYSQERLGVQALADKVQEKQLLQRFLELADQGKLLRHFFDQSVAAGMLADARSRHAALAHFDPQALANPVRLVAQPGNGAWTVTFTLAEPAREIHYRLPEDDAFASTGSGPGIDQRTGAALPNPSIQLPLETAATSLFVKYVDIRGGEQGPFELTFDPDAERLAFGKRTLEGFPHSWITIREFDGRILAYFTHLVCHRAALREVRYGIGSDSLTESFPLPPGQPDKPFEVPPDAKVYLELPPEAGFVMVQLTFQDGTPSKPHRFALPRSESKAPAAAGAPVASHPSRGASPPRKREAAARWTSSEELPRLDGASPPDQPPRRHLGIDF